MSATGRGGVRRENDFYATPADCVHPILPHLALEGRAVLDPCCGDGAILDVVAGCQPSALWGLDIEERANAREWAFEKRNALAEERWPRATCIITNPPYKLALKFVQRALLEVEPGGVVAMLLRLNWAAGIGRASFHKAHPSDLYVLSKRPSFTGDGRTDATEYAWFVWGDSYGGRWKTLDLHTGGEQQRLRLVGGDA